MSHLHLEFRLRIGTAFHTTGNHWTWQADNALARDHDGQPVIPATSIKGVLRSSAEALLRSLEIAVCESPDPATMCPSRDDLCIVCRVFGNPRAQSPLRFRNAVPVETPSIGIRSGVAISRRRHAALDQRLFFIEVAEAGPAEWLSTCDGYFVDEEAAREAGTLVQLAAMHCASIGAGRSRGLGWLERWEVSATLDGHVLDHEITRNIWQSWSGGAT